MNAPAEPSAPAPLWTIALLALAPFPIGACIYAYGPAPLAGRALVVILTWSAVVLAFLGGVRWGLESGRAAPRWTRLMISTVSPVAAWILLLSRGAMGLNLVICGFLGAFMLQWVFDHTAPDVPTRYPRLSTTLTLGACVSLAMALEKALRM
jgi:hypothetical protein